MRLLKIIMEMGDGEAVTFRKDGDSVHVSAAASRGGRLPLSVVVSLHQCDGDGLVDPLLIAVSERLRRLRS